MQHKLEWRNYLQKQGKPQQEASHKIIEDVEERRWQGRQDAYRGGTEAALVENQYNTTDE